MSLFGGTPSSNIKKDRKRRSPLVPFLLASLLFHLLLALLYLLFYPYDKYTAKPEEEQKYVEITEVPVPEEKETEPPKETKRFAERSRRVPEEKTRDNFTKRGSVSSIPQPKPQPERPEKSEQTTKAEEKPKEEKSVKKPPQIASLPKDLEEDLPVSRKESEEKKLSEITREDLFKNVPSNPLSQPETREFLGSRDAKREDTVDLDTTEFKYLSYFLKLKRQIEGVWNYPETSRLRGEQGELFLVFTLRKNGDLEGVSLINPSGYARLDDEAINAIRTAAPYAPFPEQWNSLEKLNIRAVFRYEISYGWRVR